MNFLNKICALSTSRRLSRLLKQTRDAGISSDENAPRKQRGDFKKSNLIEIARAVSDEKAQKTSSDAEVSTEVKDEKNETSVKLQTSEYGEDLSNTLDVPSLEVEEVEMTHEEALDKAFEDGKSRGYEEGLSAGRAEGKELGKEEGRTEGMN